MIYWLKFVSALGLWICFGVTLMAQDAARIDSIFPLFVQISKPIDPSLDPSLSPVDAFRTQFEIINPNSSDVRLTLQVFDSSGREVPSLNPFSRTLFIKGNGVGKDGGFQFPDAVVIGWMKVTSPQPVVARQTIKHTQENLNVPGPPLPERFKSSITKSPASATRHAIIRVTFVPQTFLSSEITGISVVFPSTEPLGVSAHGTLTLRQDGVAEKVSEKQINLGANAQIVGAFTDFFPERQFTGIFTGTLELTFDQDIYFTAIQLKTFQTGEAIEEPANGSIQ